MNLFPKYSLPSMYLLLDNPSHLTFGHTLFLAITTCLRHHTCCLDSGLEPFLKFTSPQTTIFHFCHASTLALMWEPWYSVLLNTPCNNSLTTWKFMGHTALASSSFILPCGNYFSNFMSLDLLNCVLLSSGMHFNPKGGNIIWPHPIHAYLPELNNLWPLRFSLECKQSHTIMWRRSMDTLRCSECTIGRLQEHIQSQQEEIESLRTQIEQQSRQFQDQEQRHNEELALVMHVVNMNSTMICSIHRSRHQQGTQYHNHPAASTESRA
jgi:hypothetical protein